MTTLKHYGPTVFLANAPWRFVTAMPLLTTWRLVDTLVIALAPGAV